MKDITRLSNALFVTNREQHAAALDNCHLFVRVIVRGCYYVWRNTEAADHQVFPDDHLSLNPRSKLFDWHATPVSVARL